MNFLKIVAVCMIMAYTALAQRATSVFIAGKTTTEGLLELQLRVSSSSKKFLERDAHYAAVEQVLFRGCEGTSYSKPLLDIGYKSMEKEYPLYTSELYEGRYTDFVRSCSATSRLKKTGTDFVVLIDILALKRDLVKHRLLKTLVI